MIQPTYCCYCGNRLKAFGSFLTCIVNDCPNRSTDIVLDGTINAVRDILKTKPTDPPELVHDIKLIVDLLPIRRFSEPVDQWLASTVRNMVVEMIRYAKYRVQSLYALRELKEEIRSLSVSEFYKRLPENPLSIERRS